MTKIFLLLTPLFVMPLFAQTTVLHPMTHSIGVEIQLPTGYDADQTAKCSFTYRKAASSTWLDGFEADRIVNNGIDQFRGSVFLLEEATTYEIQATLQDSFPTISTQVLPIVSIQTLERPVFAPTNNLKWVAPTGTGNAYTQTNPGNIATLLSSGTVTCGTTIMLKDGVYSTLGLALNIGANCTENTPIQFLAAPGASPIFEGGVQTSLTWMPDATHPSLYSAALPAGTDHTNLCLVNGEALYAYPTLSANPLFGNYNLVDLNFGFDGYVRDNATIWIHTQSGINPNNSNITLSKTFRFLTVYGNNRDAFLKFKGITVQHVAKPSFSGTTEYAAVAFDIRGANHVIFDSCKMYYNNTHINFSSQCNHITIQNCEFKHDNGTYTHAMIKKSLSTPIYTATSRGRAIETGAIELFANRYVTIRNNHFDGVNSGVIGSFSAGLIEEVDIYENIFIDNFDAIECDGNWSNLRVWKNEIIRPMAGFSIAPPLIGPRYFYRNLIHDMKGRRNELDDTPFSSCQAVEPKSAGIGIKTNSGNTSTNKGNLYFLNNTFYMNDSLGFVFASWDAEWRKIRFMNNIFFDESKHLGYFHDLSNKPNYQFYSHHDNYFSKNPAAPVLVAKEQHGFYNCIDIPFANIQTQISSISGSNQIQIITPFSENPNFTNTNIGGFHLNNNSPLINQGIVIKGFYDYIGNLPDIGAKESLVVSIAPAATGENIALYPNPATDNIEITLPLSLQEVSLYMYNALGQQVYYNPSVVSSNLSLDLSSLKEGFYWVEIWGDKHLLGSKKLVIHPRP